MPTLNHYTFQERGWRLNSWLKIFDQRNNEKGFDYLTDVVCELVLRTYLRNLKCELYDLLGAS